VHNDPCIPLVAAARVFRLRGDLDSAELQLNAAAKLFRDLRQPNLSRAYRHESRNLYYARYMANLRYELAQALERKISLGLPVTEEDYSKLVHDPITEDTNAYIYDVEIPSGLLITDPGP
jgi:hypothetical protein